MPASILVIDDDPSLVEVLEQVVASQNQTATSISDVDEAIRIVSQEHAYSVLVTDHRLGTFSGVELINLARQCCRIHIGHKAAHNYALQIWLVLPS